MTTALLHVHTDFSYDGRNSPEQLARWGANRGLDMICLSEHTNDFDTAKMQRLVASCGEASALGCRIVPGLEYPVRGGFHLLAFGVQDYRPSSEFEEVAGFARQQGGVSVLAHPARYRGEWPADALLARLDGIEGWNARYDGRFLPSGRVLDAASRVLRRHPHLRLFGGQDLHEATGSRLVTTTWDDGVDAADLRQRLLDGSARFGSGAIRLGAGGPPGAAALGAFRLLHAVYRGLRAARDRIAGGGRA